MLLPHLAAVVVEEAEISGDCLWLRARARPWIWGRPQPKSRSYRRRFVYIL